jgi:predicted enzyme related to lactoylglutathione lyase
MTTSGPSTIAHVFAGIPVADYGSSLAWYGRFFGRPPDIIVTQNEAMWEVVHGGWIYVVGDSNRAGKALVAVLVDDLENWVAKLTQLGVATGAIDSQPGVARNVVITDPDGNRITVGENESRDK